MFRRSSNRAPVPPGAGTVNDVSRMLRGQPVVEQEIVTAKLDDRRHQDEEAHALEQQTIADLIHREEQLSHEAKQIGLRLGATEDELKKSKLGETQLRKALDLAATRLHAAQEAASEARREQEIMQSKLYESQMDVNELRSRLQGNTGVRFSKRNVLGALPADAFGQGEVNAQGSRSGGGSGVGSGGGGGSGSGSGSETSSGTSAAERRFKGELN